MRSRLAESQLGCKISEAQGRAKRRLRKVVTGNPDKKVRDYMKEVPQVIKRNHGITNQIQNQKMFGKNFNGLDSTIQP